MHVIKSVNSFKLSLAVLAFSLALPAFAAEPTALVRTLEWSGESATLSFDSAPSSDKAHNDVWQRIRSGFKIPDDAFNNPLVANHETWYAARPAYVHRMVDRSRRYLFHIVQEIDRR